MDIPPPPFWRLYESDAPHPPPPPVPEDSSRYRHFGALLFPSLSPADVSALPEHERLFSVKEGGDIDVEAECSALLHRLKQAAAKVLRCAAAFDTEGYEESMALAEADIKLVVKNLATLCNVMRIQEATEKANNAAGDFISRIEEAIGEVDAVLRSVKDGSSGEGVE